MEVSKTSERTFSWQQINVIGFIALENAKDASMTFNPIIGNNNIGSLMLLLSIKLYLLADEQRVLDHE